VEIFLQKYLERIVLARSNTGVVRWNPTRGMDVSVLLCIVRGLASDWSPIRVVLPTLYKIKELGMSPRPVRRAIYSSSRPLLERPPIVQPLYGAPSFIAPFTRALDLFVSISGQANSVHTAKSSLSKIHRNVIRPPTNKHRMRMTTFLSTCSP
jgi:hypothetical protein